VAQVGLPSKCTTLSSTPSTAKNKTAILSTHILTFMIVSSSIWYKMVVSRSENILKNRKKKLLTRYKRQFLMGMVKKKIIAL
jgi:hypothetical protein